MMYHTGDIGRWNAGGELEFVGRRDHQVKLNGRRIELGEIESRLLSCPGVDAAVVVLTKSDNGQPMLAAYVTPEGVDVPALRRHLRSELAEPLIPAAITPLLRLPLNANGKVDRSALPRVHTGDSAAASPLESEMQLIVAGVWSRVLGVPVQSADADFFSLGGDSLQVVQVQSTLESEHGFVVEVSEWLQATTVRSLAVKAG